MSETVGLSLSDVVNITISLTPTGGAARNFGATIVIGGSGVISTSQRFRSYTDIDEVGLDFPADTPEFQAAEVFFSATPQPQQLYIGAWAKNAQPATLEGGILTPTQQLLSNFVGITAGSMQLTINGTLDTLSAMNFTGAGNLNGVAGVVSTALGDLGTCTWEPNLQSFVITTTETGATATITNASPTGSGTDVSALMGLTASSGTVITQGSVAETPLAALQALALISNDWYMSGFADTSITDIEQEANAAFIEAASPSRVYGYTTQETEVLNSQITDDIGSNMKDAGFTRTIGQYSSTDAFAIFGIFGRFATINYATGVDTAIIAKFQTEPSITPEILTEPEAASLTAKNVNVFATYQNNTSIIEQGTMASGLFFDVRQSVDWLQNQAQSDLFNAFITIGTKIAQTDAGVNILVNTLSNTLTQAVTNGVAAPGIWNAQGFGALQTGQFLPSGFYILAQSVNSQSETDRVTRVAPPIMAAVKLAGALQSANVAISVNQ
jgi:hypothetical protein